MATISICNRLNGKTKRLKVEGVNIKGKVAEFRSKVSRATEVPIHEIGECSKKIIHKFYYRSPPFMGFFVHQSSFDLIV